MRKDLVWYRGNSNCELGWKAANLQGNGWLPTKVAEEWCRLIVGNGGCWWKLDGWPEEVHQCQAVDWSGLGQSLAGCLGGPRKPETRWIKSHRTQ
jgi:hypothetical protein